MSLRCGKQLCHVVVTWGLCQRKYIVVLVCDWDEIVWGCCPRVADCILACLGLLREDGGWEIAEWNLEKVYENQQQLLETSPELIDSGNHHGNSQSCYAPPKADRMQPRQITVWTMRPQNS
jgi:hypothetical protein